MATLEITRGATANLRSLVTPVDLVLNSTIFFMAKRSYSDADDDAIISKTSEVDGGILVTDEDTGEVVTSIDPADTRALPNRETYLFYELEVEKAGNVYLLERGKLLVKRELIQRTL